MSGPTLRPSAEHPGKASKLQDDSDDEFEDEMRLSKGRSKVTPRKSSRNVVISQPATTWIEDVPGNLSELVAGVRKHVPGVCDKSGDLFRVFSLSATRTCAVLTGIHGFTVVSSTGRVVMVHAEHAPKIPIDHVHESELKIPDEELKARLFAHLNTMPKRYQGERLEYQIDVMIQPQASLRHSGRSLADDQENEKEELFAEPWNLVFSDLRIPGEDVI